MLPDADTLTSREFRAATGGRILLIGCGALAHEVLDLKAPASGESGRNRWENLDHLQAHDQIKFVIASRQDFDWAVEQVRERNLTRWDVLFSPVWETLPPRELADWLLESGLEARLQLQTHKVLWGDQPGK